MERQGSKLNFNGQNIYVGIDVHLKRWSVAVLSERAVLKRFSQSPSADELYTFLIRNYPNATYHSVYEAGFCGFVTHERLCELGVNNIVVNPMDVPTMQKEKIRKTDAVDCVKLARGLRSGELTGIYVHSRKHLELRSLTRLRNTIVKDLSREKNRIKSFIYFYGIEYPEQWVKPGTHWSRRFMDWLRSLEFATDLGAKTLDVHIRKAEYLRGMLLEYTRTMRVLLRSEPYQTQMNLLLSVPGVGQTTASTLLTEIEDISRFSNSDKLAAYIGFIPMCHSSGEKQNNGSMTIRKHATLRYYIIEASWRAIQYDPAMTLAFEEYCKRMSSTRAIVKIGRRIINRIHSVMKNQKAYVTGIAK